MGERGRWGEGKGRQRERESARRDRERDYDTALLFIYSFLACAHKSGMCALRRN